MTGRTPLHIACAKNDEYSAAVVQLLIDHNANPNFICNGFSPLSLAIASGNKEAVDILLKSGFCDLSLPLTNGVGSALSVICSTLYEPNWPVAERLKLASITQLATWPSRPTHIPVLLPDRQAYKLWCEHCAADCLRSKAKRRHGHRLCALHAQFGHAHRAHAIPFAHLL